MAQENIRLTKLTECAGCGAKVGAGELQKLLSDLKVRRDPDLLVGFDRSDDAAVYRITDELAIVQTVDFFPPIADDPYTFGAIAAANALSDIYAMGGEPKTALNIMMVPEGMERETVQEILRGGYDKVFEAGAVIAGGHSIYDPEPKYGMAVTGFVNPKKMLTNQGALPGDVIIYTKPIGIGVLTTAEKGGVLEDHELLTRVLDVMKTLNRYARDVMVKYTVHACTDITGFGVCGHLLEVAEASDVEIHLCPEALTALLLPKAEYFARLGILPSGVYRNRHFAEAKTESGSTPRSLMDLLYDPQTSGGLMIFASPDDADALVSALSGDSRILAAQVIGEVRRYEGGKRIFVI